MSKFLDQSGVTTLWGKVKEFVNNAIKTNVTDKLGVASGIATLGADSKLTATQLPALKTVNGETIVGSGNITIDLSIYTIVESLPELTAADANKIYLVLSSTAGEQDKYTEYIKANNAWEKLGEYKADVDLTPYVKKNDLDTLVGQAGYIKETAIDSKVSALGYAKTADVEGKGYQNKAQVEAAIAAAVTGGTLDLSSYVKFTDIASASKAGAMSTELFNKLNAIEAQATKDEAITTTELNAILV